MSKNKEKRAISLISGVVARSRQGVLHDKKSERETYAHLLRNGLSNAYLQARSRIKSFEVKGFFDEAKRLTRFEENRFSSVPIRFSYLTLLQSLQPRSLKFEIHWLAHRLASESSQLRIFIEKKTEIERHVVAGDFRVALSKLDDLDSERGCSLWAISTRISLVQEIAGDEAQKAYSAEIRAQYKKAVLPVFIRHVSQRAESSVPIGWYVENTKRRLISKTKEDLNLYFLYKIVGEWPAATKNLAAILRVEQNHHIFDIYETFVATLQQLSIRQINGSLVSQIRSAVEMLGEIDDFRLEKLAVAFGERGPLNICQIFDIRDSDAAVTGKVAPVYRDEVARLRLSSSLSPVSTLILSLFQSTRTRVNSTAKKSSGLGLRGAYLLATESMSGRSRAFDQRGIARKLAYVFATLPYAAALLALSEAQSADSVSKQFNQLRLAALNCPDISFLDVAANATVAEVARYYLDKLPVSATRDLATLFVEPSHTPRFALSPSLSSYAASCAHYASARYSEVELSIHAALAAPSKIIARGSAVIALSAYGANGDLANAAALISRELAAHGRAANSLPISAVFEGVPWPELSPLADTISMSNALAAYAEVDGSDKVRTNRIFALQKVLAKYGVDRPSQLLGLDTGASEEEFAYFLRYACSTDVLDMLRRLRSSREVLEERRDIYAALAQLDPENADEYRFQLVTISKEIRVNQGLKTIDASRVHVDIPAIRNILRRELSDSFSRHQQLVKGDQSPPDTFDALLRDLIKPELSARLWLMPHTEADELLFVMVNVAKDRFLFNIPHGLDSYLSKRIRHGSIIGFLRAPVEAERLITQQHSDGRYKENPRWESAIAHSKNPVELQKAFLVFARAFDQYLLRLKDVLLHVRTDEKPLGIFDAKISTTNYRLFRAVAREDRTLETFLDTMLSGMRGLLNPSLEAASNLISQETSKHVDGLFAELRRNIQLYMDYGLDRTNLQNALNRASSEVQSAITTVAGWFSRIELEDVRFSMEDACAIAAESVKSLNRNFFPQITIDDQSSLAFDVHQLPFMQDIMLVAFGNVAEWSNLSSPKIDISARYCVKTHLLDLEIINDMEPGEDLSSIRSKIEAARPRLRDVDYIEHARREGNSGIPKLASIVCQSEYGRLDVCLTEDVRFKLTLTLSIIPEVQKNADSDS